MRRDRIKIANRTGQLGQGSHTFVGNAAGVNPLEMGKIGIDIEGESVHRYPPVDGDSQGSYLS
ncbi:MAG TPA: hypothetical protein VHY08_09150, partial [Bacillota bacterium]|nr:hypothetical protein [Bacillota bacterium]